MADACAPRRLLRKGLEIGDDVFNLLRGLRADPLMHACHTLRHEMIHFVYNLQYYLMFEVRARRDPASPDPPGLTPRTPIHLYRCSSARGTRCKLPSTAPPTSTR